MGSLHLIVFSVRGMITFIAIRKSEKWSMISLTCSLKDSRTGRISKAEDRSTERKKGRLSHCIDCHHVSSVDSSKLGSSPYLFDSQSL